jgi:UDP-glucose-4-epimerase GalE
MIRYLFLILIQVFLWSDSYVVVTGGAGYIGSQTCKALKAAGYTPVVYDSLHAGKISSVKWGPLVVGELNDRAKLDKLFDEYHPVGVIHFAALIAVGESVKDPSKYYWTNVVGTLTLLDAVKDHTIPAFIFSSSAATYGIPETSLVNEDSPQNPINPYGNTKLIGEKMINDFAEAYKIPYICFRYFNAAGADLDNELGQNNVEQATHLIPLVLQTAAKKRTHVDIYGTDFPTPDGTGVRDYIHVVDLADAHVLALKHLLDGHESLILNLGTGHGYSVKEVIDATKKITGCEIPVAYRSRRAGDPPALIADTTQAKNLLGWEPHHSDLETIIRTSWNWYSLQIGIEKLDR